MVAAPQMMDTWTNAERWCWNEICAGRIADFNKRYDINSELDPKSSADWENQEEQRLLSADFLVTILTQDSMRCAMSFQGVRIIGAWFKEPIELNHARLERQLWLEKCRLEAALQLIDLGIDSWFSLESSHLIGDVNLGGAMLKSHVSLSSAAFEAEVNLTAAKIGGLLT
ncbi:MAG: hypothetical protein ETSY1_43775 [Candidatus Entotheonella factor]|uniref:Pentapeptide repeat-containing protein n=1 Tax=Entotheonella factor TaxID=1429438 RepID=W4L411_ENTF1|nr:MAG: hypothetical protein ETSY1_43775 [Candidatus Entotheonella factor]